jgi:hypothetical protein
MKYLQLNPLTFQPFYWSTTTVSIGALAIYERQKEQNYMLIIIKAQALI